MKDLQKIEDMFQSYVDECLKTEVEFRIPLVSMSYAMDLINGTREGDLDSNGWDSDYWESARLNDGRVARLSGSGYYGGVTVEVMPINCKNFDYCDCCNFYDECENHE